MARLELHKLARTYAGGIVAVEGVNLTVEDGELFVIVGPSGSGKSTLLRLVAGLEAPDGGTILLDGERIDGLAPADRGVAMVFQDQVLYPHLDVFENIAFGLRARRVGKTEVAERVRASATTLGLADCLDRRPGTLSGGQRRRVALGRAMVLRPRLFLFDEPFSGLDAPLRASTRSELADLNRKTGASMVLVTHDQEEALALGDRVAVLDRGRVVQVGRPLDLYHRPDSRFVARFLGQPPINLLPCFVEASGENLSVGIIGLKGIEPWSLPRDHPWALRMGDETPRVELGLRPEQLLIGPGHLSNLTGTIHRLEPMGHETVAYLTVGPHELTARLPAWSTFRAGEIVPIGLDPAGAIWFDASSGLRLA